MISTDILHETRYRLRLGIPRHLDLDSLALRLAESPGVRSVRINAALHCLVVLHDGRAETREKLLKYLRVPKRRPNRQRTYLRKPASQIAFFGTALLALSVPVLNRDWRPGAALVVVAGRILTQSGRLRSDPSAVLFDALSLASLALSGQPMVVSTSVLLRQLSELLSARLVREADSLLDQLLPTANAQYIALQNSGAGAAWKQSPLRSLGAGDFVRIFPGDVVPIDGCVLSGTAVLSPAAHQVKPHSVSSGDHVSAGERLQVGMLELYAEADAASSRLEKLRRQVQHAIQSREPVGNLTPGVERLLSLPLTASALVFGLTADTARAAAMLQADPQQGLDLAVPLAREAALYALARQGLLTAGLQAVERLAIARTLVLQDTGVLATGRWSIEAVNTEPGGDIELVRGWLAALASTPIEVLDRVSFPDRVVRQWVRHGAVLRVKEHELHLASRCRLLQVWGLKLGDSLQPSLPTESLRRELAVVASGRVVAKVTLVSVLRPGVLDWLREIATLGFERVALFVEADGNEDGEKSNSMAWTRSLPGIEKINDDPGSRADWLANASRDGVPLVMVHTVLRDLVPPGSLSLTPADADAGSHGVLLGDPLVSLYAARCVAQTVHKRMHMQQMAASVGNAVMMTAAALRWLPPMGTALMHHALAFLLLLYSLRIESIRPKQNPPEPSILPNQKQRRHRPTKSNPVRSEIK